MPGTTSTARHQDGTDRPLDPSYGLYKEPTQLHVDYTAWDSFVEGDKNGRHELDFTIDKASFYSEHDQSSFTVSPGENGINRVFLRGFEIYIDGLQQTENQLITVNLKPQDHSSMHQYFCKFTKKGGKIKCEIIDKKFAPQSSSNSYNRGTFGSFQYWLPDSSGKCSGATGRQMSVFSGGTKNQVCQLKEAGEVCGGKDKTPPTYCVGTDTNTEYFNPASWTAMTDSTSISLPSLYARWTLTVTVTKNGFSNQNVLGPLKIKPSKKVSPCVDGDLSYGMCSPLYTSFYITSTKEDGESLECDPNTGACKPDCGF